MAFTHQSILADVWFIEHEGHRLGGEHNLPGYYGGGSSDIYDIPTLAFAFFTLWIRKDVLYLQDSIYYIARYLPYGITELHESFSAV